MNKNPSIKKNFILSMLFQILNIITPLITAPYISRVLGTNSVGIYSYTSSLQLYFSIFAALGTATYGCREISINRNNKKNRSKIFWEIELLTIFTSIICIIFYLLLISFSGNYAIYLLVLGIKLINTMLDISWFYIGIEELKYIVYKNIIFKIIGIILLFILIKSPDDLMLYIIIMCGTTLLGTISMWFYIPKFISKVDFHKLNVFQHFKHTLVYFIPTIATTIYTNIDKTLIGLITKDMNESAYYEQTTKVLELAKSITFISLNSLLTSRMAFLFSEQNYVEMQEKIKLSINYILMIGIAISFGIIGVSDRLVPMFFGDGFDKVILLLKIFIFVIVITGFSNCLETQYYTPAGRRKDSAKFIILGSFINVILNIILIPFFSSIGAIISSIIAESFIFYLYIKNCNHFVRYSYIFKSSIKKIVAGLWMLFIILFLDKWILNDYLAILVEIIVGATSYFIILFVLKDSFFKKYVLKIVFEFYKKNITILKGKKYAK